MSLLRSHRVPRWAACLLLSWPAAAFAWGDEGHQVIGLIAERYIAPATRATIDALLETDASGLTAGRSMAWESTWADRYRDSDPPGVHTRRRATQAWHYVDIEIDAPDLDAACGGHPPLPPGIPASAGPPEDCVVDKIRQFSGELADPGTAAPERLLALQFLLHLVGDLHQPLHAADHFDHGGNGVRVRAEHAEAGNLHHYWDAVFVRRLGRAPEEVAAQLIGEISPRRRLEWSAGSPEDWARESFEIARTRAYGPLPAAGAHGSRWLDDAYGAAALETVRRQLEKAGVRLAHLLDAALADVVPSAP